MAKSTVIPFTRERQICDPEAGWSFSDSDSASLSLPGWPGIQISDTRQVYDLLRKEIYAEELERVAGRLWVLTSMKSDNIRALHEQRVWNREIVITENPKLHLVWTGHRMFIKPLPAFLMSWDVWKNCLTGKDVDDVLELGGGGVGVGVDDDVRRAALGFLRSYRYLIRHESDFKIAKSADLLPIPESVRWLEFSKFLDEIENTVHDCDVSLRYQYGELRLSRLNLYAPFLFRSFNYEYMSMEYSEYFARLWAPVLVAFVIISTMLDTMQVALGSGQNISAPLITSNVFYWFSIVALILIVGLLIGSGSIWGFMVLKEVHYAMWSERHWKLRKDR